MPPKRKPDPSGNKDLEGTRPRKRKGKEKEYDDFQDTIGVRRPPHALSREQHDIKEATRLSLQTRPATKFGESSSSAVVRLNPRINRSNVVANLEEDDDEFQEPS